MKIGLFFGTFNPLHNGHLIIAKTAIAKALIDQVWYVLSPISPFKQKEKILEKNKRANLIEKALLNEEKLILCKQEFNLPIPNYSIDTLKVLKKRYPNYIFKILLGQDNFSKIKKWKNHKTILDNHEIILYPRLGFDFDDLQSQKVLKLDVPLINYSSTKIRDMIRKGLSIKEYVPASVEKEIFLNKYYD